MNTKYINIIKKDNFYHIILINFEYLMHIKQLKLSLTIKMYHHNVYFTIIISILLNFYYDSRRKSITIL